MAVSAMNQNPGLLGMQLSSGSVMQMLSDAKANRTNLALDFIAPEIPLVSAQLYVNSKDVLIQLGFFETQATAYGEDWERRTLLAHVFTPTDVVQTAAFLLGTGAIPGAMHSTGLLNNCTATPATSGSTGSRFQYQTWAHAVVGTLVVRHGWSTPEPPVHWPTTRLTVIPQRYDAVFDDDDYATDDDRPRSAPTGQVPAAIISRAFKYHHVMMLHQLVHQGYMETLVGVSAYVRTMVDTGLSEDIIREGYISRLLMYDEIPGILGAGARSRLLEMGYGHFVFVFDAK